MTTTAPQPPRSPQHDSDPFHDGPDPFRGLAKASWPVALTLGLCSIALGVMALVWPGRTVHLIAIIFGIYLLVSGVMQFAQAFSARFSGGTRVLMLLSGILSIVLGVMCFRSLMNSVVLLGLWIGISWLFRGTVEIGAALSLPGTPGKGWAVALGVLNILAGLVLISMPVTSVVVLAVFAGCGLVVLGIFEIVAAIRLHHSSKEPSA
jgi:uncharacterized membrane protein HdeD (DUF308 family)